MSFKNIEYTKVEFDDTDHLDNSGERDEVQKDSAELIADKASYPFWKFQFYQNLFDIDTTDVLRRISFSFVPYPTRSFLSHVIRNKPDLYGPFWTCTTLIVTIAVAGNIANYFQYSKEKYTWRYDFKKLSLAAMTIYSYWWIMPLIVWGVAKAKKIVDSSFMELLTMFGYSLAIYIPISVLCVIQLNWLQWLLVLAALILSGVVLLISIWARYSPVCWKMSVILSVIVAVMHSALSFGFMFYFFYVPSVHANITKSKPG